jgi:hypothetical protein
MSNLRVYVENIQFTASRRDLIEVFTNLGGVAPISLQVVRKRNPDLELSQLMCSAIATFSSHEDCDMVIRNLNMTDYTQVSHVLHPAARSFRAKYAYPQGSRSIATAKAAAWTNRPPLVPTPPSVPPPGFLIPPPPLVGVDVAPSVAVAPTAESVAEVVNCSVTML